MNLKTNMMPLSIIIAVDQKGGFGKNGKIPWNFSEDMKHFKEVTTGSVCIMGRKTYEDMHEMVISKKKAIGSPPTIPKIEHILPNRTSFVVTSNTNYKAEGATVVPSIRAAIQTLDENERREIFVIGGQRMYIEALTWTSMIYMTIIKDEQYDCDRFFPLETLNKYKIVDGKETKELYFVTYKLR